MKQTPQLPRLPHRLAFIVAQAVCVQMKGMTDRSHLGVTARNQW
jgi:hypothetical protein